MKISKKFGGLGLGLIILLLFSTLLVFHPRGVLADPFTDQSDWRNATYNLNSKSTIVVTFPNHPAVTFTDSVPGDTTHNYTPNTNNTGVCNGSISLTSTDPFNTRPSIGGSVSVGIQIAGSAILCSDGGIKFSDSSITITNNLSSTGAAADTGPAKITYGGQVYTQIDQGSNAIVYGKTTSVANCYGGSLIVLGQIDSAANAPVQGSVAAVKLSPSGTGTSLSSVVDLPTGFPVANGSLGKCVYNDSIPIGTVNVDVSGAAVTVVCDSSICDPSTATTPAADNTDSSACVANSHTSLEWILCPVTTTISKAVDSINVLIEGQLNFDVSSNLANGSGVHKAWALIKNIVSAILVIVLLVMVISQAIGGGPFEAYTVRKMLPKLVAAVILMQVSWELCKWSIALANDAGQGIGQLLAAPFGGGGNLDLNSILHRLNPGWALGSQVIIPTLLVGGAILAAVTLPGTLVMAFGLFIGVFMALMMLLFRNVLVVALVIFSPLAFLIWTLPGQALEGYWKLWKDNFIKLLMLFPIIISIIYTGRIFAWIVAGQGSAGFIDYLTVLVAYFGPYFVIFKAYKWGGSLYGAAGSAVAKGRQGLVKSNSPWIKSLGERAQGNLANRYEQASQTQREARARAEKLQNHIKTLRDAGKPTRRAEARLEKENARLAGLGRTDRTRRAFFRIASGHPIPSERGQIETLATAAAYKKDLVDKKAALIHNDFVEELNRNGGNVQGAKEYIRDKYELGNMQKDGQGRIITDEHGDPRVMDGYTERAYHNWTIDTKSWMELGDEEWRMAAIEGAALPVSDFKTGGQFAYLNPTNDEKRAAALSKKSKIIGYRSDPTLTRRDILEGKKPNFDTAKTTGFMGMMNADGQRYAQVAEKLPTLQPFNQELGGGPKRDEFRAQATVAPAEFMPGGTYAARNPAADPAIASQLATDESTRRSILLAEDARFGKWFRNMEHPTELATVRTENYQMMDDVKQQLEAVGLKSQSAEKLQIMIEELAESRTAESSSILQRLMGGERSARGAVNDMFGPGYLESKLNVDIRVPTIEAIGTKIKGSGMPSSVILAAPDQRAAFKQELIAKPLTSNPTAQEVAQALAEAPGYSKSQHGLEQKDLRDVLLELRGSSGSSQLASQRFNDIVDNINARLEGRVQRIVKRAVSEGRTPDEVEQVSRTARAAANTERTYYESLKLPRPLDDPSILTVGH